MHMFSNLFETIELLVGNNQERYSKLVNYKKMLAVILATVYAAAFTIGLFLGDLTVAKAIEFEPTIGLLTTILSYTLGFSIIYSTWTRSQHLILAGLATVVILSQTALIFNLIPMPLTNILFYAGNVLTLIFLHSYTHKKNDST